jgi:hypothetical protein
MGKMAPLSGIHPDIEPFRGDALACLETKDTADWEPGVKAGSPQALSSKGDNYLHTNFDILLPLLPAVGGEAGRRGLG